METSEKKCAICSHVFSGSSLQCPNCGRSVFEAQKTQSQVQAQTNGTFGEDAINAKHLGTPQTKTKSGWLSRLFGKSNAGKSNGSPTQGKSTMKLFRNTQDGFDKQKTESHQLADSLLQKAGYLENKDRLEEALVLYKTEMSIRRRLEEKFEMASCLENQALILFRLGRKEKALKMYREAEPLFRDLDAKVNLAFNLSYQFTLLKDLLDRPVEAVPIAEEAYRLAIGQGIVISPGSSLDDIRKVIESR